MNQKTACTLGNFCPCPCPPYASCSRISRLVQSGRSGSNDCLSGSGRSLALDWISVAGMLLSQRRRSPAAFPHSKAVSGFWRGVCRISILITTEVSMPPTPQPRFEDLEKDFHRLYREFFDHAEKKRRWSLRGDIPWDDVNRSLDPAIADVVES